MFKDVKIFAVYAVTSRSNGEFVILDTFTRMESAIASARGFRTRYKRGAYIIYDIKIVQLEVKKDLYTFFKSDEGKVPISMRTIDKALIKEDTL